MISNRKHRSITELDAIDDSHPASPNNQRDHAAPEISKMKREEFENLCEALRHMVEWMASTKTSRSAGARVQILALTLGINPRGIKTYQDIAIDAGISREAVRQAAAQLENKYGLHTGFARHNARGRKMK